MTPGESKGTAPRIEEKAAREKAEREMAEKVAQSNNGTAALAGEDSAAGSGEVKENAPELSLDSIVLTDKHLGIVEGLSLASLLFMARDDALESLTHLGLSQNSLDDVAICAIADAVRQNHALVDSLKRIELDSNRIGDVGGKSLNGMAATLRALTTLHLVDNPMGPETALQLTGGAKSRALAPELVVRFTPMDRVRTGAVLDLGGKGLSPSDAVFLASDLSVSEGFTSLDLSLNRLCGLTSVMAETGKRRKPEMASPAAGKTSLRTAKSFASSPAASSPAGPGISTKPRLRSNQSDSVEGNFAADGVVTLAVAARDLKALHTLVLNGNTLCDGGAEALAVGLTGSESLTSLYLQSNRIGVKGAVSIAVALESMQSIAVLDLSCNQICGVALDTTAKPPRPHGSFAPEAVVALVLALSSPSSLISLILDDNLVGPLGMRAMGEALVDAPWFGTLQALKCDGFNLPPIEEPTLDFQGRQLPSRFDLQMPQP